MSDRYTPVIHNPAGTSVIVPAWNEAENLPLLIKRLSDALFQQSGDFEILLVDDNSTDNTKEKIKALSSKYPVRYIKKTGKQGKAFSLLQGFSVARFPIVAMIDADLQYPPEALPEMISMVLNGTADVVVGNRRYRNVSSTRKVVSHVFRYIFAELLHDQKVDVQSGLKVFRKEIIDRIELRPSQWTFDLEFLLKSEHAGYTVAGKDIEFSARHAGQSKVKLLSSMWEIGSAAVKQKFRKLEQVPLSSDQISQRGYGFHYKGKEYIHHTQLLEKFTALDNFSHKQKYLLAGIAVLFAIALALSWHYTLIVTISVLTTLYFIDLLFYFFLIAKSLAKNQEISISEEALEQYKGKWPRYTILCPLYKEWQVVPQFIDAMNALDYPKDKLQVMLLLEEDDRTTIEEMNKIALPDFFEVVVVPDSQPKTKPKACNYGLARATGDFSVIYDAEDIPDPLQLKKTVLAFNDLDEETVCVQAKLNFYNPEQNILTRIFTAEYALWFNLILTGLQGIDAPIPLGGTSNHFRTKDLKQVQGWDSFNVTEDCDLGVRLAREGYRTAVINSVTMEEANSELSNWFWQRTRWIKGYIQTYLVHMRHPRLFIEKTKAHHFPVFQLVVGGKVLLSLINPVMWVMTVLYFMSRTQLGPFIESLFPPYALYIGVVSLVFGNFLYLYYYMLGCARLGQYNLIKYTYLVPVYWLMMSVAAWTSVYQLIKRPHHWAKTKHGLHLQNSSYPSVAENILSFFNKPRIRREYST